MKVINATIDENRELNAETVTGYSGDSNAEMLVVDLSGFGGFDSYAIYVRNTALGAVKRLEAGTDSDTNPYVKDGVMYINLTSDLTCGGKLSLEIEGIKVENGLTVRKLTSVANINFKPSMASAAEQGEFKGGAETELRLLAAALAKRLTALEERESSAGTAEVPYADKNTVGGFKLDEDSPVSLDENGYAVPNYGGIDYVQMLASIVGLILIDNEDVIGSVNETASPDNGVLMDLTCNVADESAKAAVVTFNSFGNMSYYNENYEEVEEYFMPTRLYVFTLKNGAMTVAGYYPVEFYKLLKEGIIPSA